jgi:hypothetical protein
LSANRQSQQGTENAYWYERSGHAGCSKSSFSKAAASEDPEAYPLGYVEGLNDARTTLADFFSILLVEEGERL